MKAWKLDRSENKLSLVEVERPGIGPGAVLVRVQAVPLLSYMHLYVTGQLPYWYPESPFTPGSNGVGVIESVGEGVYHLRPGQRVIVGPHLLAKENVAEPAQILIGLTGLSADCGPMLAAHRDGTLAEYARTPCSVLTQVEGLDHVSVEQLAPIGKFAIPLGGLLRGRLSAGEILIVNGATGNFGSGGVVVGLALGASRVVAAGRQRRILDELEAIGGGRVVGVALTGEVERDRKALRDAAGGGANVALDFVGGATDPNSTLATLTSLARGGRMVLMGSLKAPLPIDYGQMLMNDWELMGNFMHRPAALRALLNLVRGGLLDLGQLRTQSFKLEELPRAIEAARAMRGLQATVVRCSDS